MHIEKHPESHELVLVLPLSMLEGTEPGQALPQPVVDIIVNMSLALYYPTDFGEATYESIELWFEKGSTLERTLRAMTKFIISGGQV